MTTQSRQKTWGASTRFLTTLLAPTSGWARVATHDVIQHPNLVRLRINMVSGVRAG